MATSNSVDFSQTAATIIKDALLLINGIEDDESPSASQEAIALRALNRLVKSWSTKPLKVWTEAEYTLDLVSGTASYTLSAINKPYAIYNARRVVNSIETPIDVVERSRYMDQTSKDSTGKPVYVYLDKQLADAVLYVWPTPDSSSDDVKFSYRSYIEDFDSSSNDPHFPSEWLDALVYNLALRLCPMYEVSGEDRAYIMQMAKECLYEAENSDIEQGSIYLEPESAH